MDDIYIHFTLISQRVSNMLIGEYNHTIDTKGRLIVPAKYRELLGDAFVVTKGLDGCLSMYPDNEWQEFENKLRQLPMNKKNARQLTRFFLAGATNCEVDKQGRILLPANLREFAGLEKEVVLVGMLNRVEIWNKFKWVEENTYEDMDDVAETMEDFGITL